jgi:hypothetical protein
MVKVGEIKGLVLVLALVVLTLTGVLGPRMEFGDVAKTDFTVGYALLSEEQGPYVIPSTAGGFLYDSPSGFVYINGAGQYVNNELGGVGVQLVDGVDTLSEVELKSKVSGGVRGYILVMYLNVLWCITLVMGVEYYRLKMGGLGKDFNSKVLLYLKLGLLVTVISLGYNIRVRGVVEVGDKALVEPSVYYIPLQDDGLPYYVETPIGVLEYGNGVVTYEGESVRILSDTYVYDGYLTSKVSWIISRLNKEDRWLSLLASSIIMATTGYVFLKLVTYKVGGGVKD